MAPLNAGAPGVYWVEIPARLPRSTYFCTLPVAVFGSSLTTWNPSIANELPPFVVVDRYRAGSQYDEGVGGTDRYMPSANGGASQPR